jgi:hypothetical protein
MEMCKVGYFKCIYITEVTYNGYYSIVVLSAVCELPNSDVYQFSNKEVLCLLLL